MINHLFKILTKFNIINIIKFCNFFTRNNLYHTINGGFLILFLQKERKRFKCKWRMESNVTSFDKFLFSRRYETNTTQGK